MNLFEEFFSIVSALDAAGIRHAVAGGLAMAVYDEPRFTRDIDLLISPSDLPRLHEVLEAIGYEESTESRTVGRAQLTLQRFDKTEGEDHMVLDLMIGPPPRYQEMLERAIEQPWARGVVRVVRREDLIWLKAQRGSEQDILDIKRLRRDEH